MQVKMMQQRKRRNILAFKIGAIFSGGCGSTKRAPNTSIRSSGDEENESLEVKERLISGKTSQQIQVRKLSISGFLRKRSSGFNLRKWRMIKIRSGNAANGATRWILRPRFRRIIGKGDDVDKMKKELASDVELCKKRILMGGKCRPLNPSGVLHYDQQGVLLPE